jgi:uncharacterized membrane protein
MDPLWEGIQEAPNVHPLFLHFPIVLLPLALAFWLLALATSRADFFKMGRWVLTLAALSAIPAAWSGMAAEEQVGHDTHLHELIHRHKAFMLTGSGLSMVLAGAGFLARKTKDQGLQMALATGLAATVAVMMFGADHGGHAVFGHGIGTRVQRDGSLTEVPHPELEEHPGHGEKRGSSSGEPTRDHHQEPAPPKRKAPQHHEGHEKKDQHESRKPAEAHPPEHRMPQGTLGLPHSRDASGTAWQPDSTPVRAYSFMEGDWMLMLHGNVHVGYDFQSSRRGEDQWLSTNWVMFMASHPLAGGDVSFRTMLSLEPATVGRDGYPELLQTGESLGGRPLHDVQHPHDLFMEVAAIYKHPLTTDLGVELYAAPSGEPALGPPGFPHRLSAMLDPMAPLGHHWQDSTHIAFGVLTAGLYNRAVKVEGSWFNGREPDENRWDFDLRTPDSWSTRLTVNPTANLSAQVSYGELRSPEQLRPEASLVRVTASATANLPVWEKGNWATTLAFGRNREEREHASPSFLLESTLEVDEHHAPFGRVEWLRKTGHDLFLPPPAEDERFGITSFVLGYAYHFDAIGGLQPGLGFRFAIDQVDPDLEPFYGRRTVYGFMVFFHLWPERMSAPRH